MKPSRLKAFLKSALPAMRPIAVFGPPGCAKTSCIEQVAKEMGIDYQDIRLFLHGPEDFKFPLIDIGYQFFAHVADAIIPAMQELVKQKGAPAWVKHMAQMIKPIELKLEEHHQQISWVQSILPTDPKWEGIICLEELPQAAPLVQNVASPILLERRLGDYELPKKAFLTVTGNRVQDRAGANRLLKHVEDRLVCLEMDVDLEDWTTWANAARLHPAVISYIRFAPSKLNTFDPSVPGKTATPRGYHMVSDLLDVTPTDCLYDMVRGVIGDAGAAEFTTHLKIHKSLPKMEDVLASPHTFRLPDDPAINYALVSALAHHAGNDKISDDELDAIVTVGNRYDSDFGMLLLRDCFITQKRIRSRRGMQDFMKKHRDVLVADI